MFIYNFLGVNVFGLCNPDFGVGNPDFGLGIPVFRLEGVLLDSCGTTAILLGVGGFRPEVATTGFFSGVTFVGDFMLDLTGSLLAGAAAFFVAGVVVFVSVGGFSGVIGSEVG
jgi:hypothetical protein